MKLYMDESGNGQPSYPLIVGAVETDADSDEIEERIQQLYRRLSARQNLVGLPSFDEFRRNGFHASEDPLEVSSQFLELMRDLSFRAYVLVTDRTSDWIGATETQKLVHMYERLLGDLLIRHRTESELRCFIEQNDSLKRLVQSLSVGATQQGLRKLGRTIPLPRLSIEMVGKTQAMSMAIVDYVMLAIGRWIRSGRSTDPANWQYRAFREVEPFISVLYSLEDGLISSRKVPLH